MTEKNVINQPITRYEIKTDKNPVLETLSITMERPDKLPGATYILKLPNISSNVYLTINDIILNSGTPNEDRKPFEIFIMSDQIEFHQWITIITRMTSMLFRANVHYSIVVKEMKTVFDPHNGNYWKKGEGLISSLVADIGLTIEKHSKLVGYKDI